MDFKSFNLNDRIQAGVQSEGYTTPTPIQVKAIGPIMEGRDVMGLAQTGSGKTAAFVLPILHRLMKGKMGAPRVLIVVPTRELAEQIHQTVESLGRHTRIRSMTIYGGVSIDPQAQKIKKGVEVIVGCPGRILDHLNRGTLNLSKVDVLVLDEADHMFDMGFLPDIRRIIGRAPRKRQTLLFSATMPKEIRALANDFLTTPVEVLIDAGKPVSSVNHTLFPVQPQEKTAALIRILKDTGNGPVLVFTRTKRRAKRLGLQLFKAGFNASSIQGNLSQNQRQAALDGFKNGRYQILVATDIAARGIDVARVSHVINFDMPASTDAYIHRIGRTGRASYSGEAFTFFTDEDSQMVRDIDRILGTRVETRRLADFGHDRPGASSDGKYGAGSKMHSSNHGVAATRSADNSGRSKPERRDPRAFQKPLP